MKKLFLIVVWGILGPLIVMQMLEKCSSKTWPSVTGTITSSRVISGNKSSGRGHSRTSAVHYEIRVTYRYPVDGMYFTGNRIKINPDSTTIRKFAEEELLSYPVGKTVTVYYDPENPEKSVLTR